MMQYFHGTCGTNETWLQESIDLQFMSKIYRMHHAQLLVVAPTCLFRSSRSACPMAGSLATFCRFLACFCLLSISCMIQEIRDHTFNISYDELTTELLFQTKPGSVCLAPPHSVLAVRRGTFATQYSTLGSFSWQRYTLTLFSSSNRLIRSMKGSHHSGQLPHTNMIGYRTQKWFPLYFAMNKCSKLDITNMQGHFEILKANIQTLFSGFHQDLGEGYQIPVKFGTLPELTSDPHLFCV